MRFAMQPNGYSRAEGEFREVRLLVAVISFTLIHCCMSALLTASLLERTPIFSWTFARWRFTVD
jgi:hypothetical protein